MWSASTMLFIYSFNHNKGEGRYCEITVGSPFSLAGMGLQSVTCLVLTAMFGGPSDILFSF